MKYRIPGLSALASLIFVGAASAGPYDDAHAAHQRSDGAAYLKIIQPLAEKGEARAEWDLGGFYLEGWAGTKDVPKGIEWLRKAADQGYLDAEVELASIYMSGNGVPKDEVQAAALIKKAGEQGDKRAPMMLLAFCMSEKPPGEECAQGVRWLKTSAEEGDTESMQRLADLYDRGGYPGIQKDTAKSVELYQRAADKGDPDAESLLAMRYELGVDVKEDKAKALALHQQAAAQGDMMSEMSLAQYYADDTNLDHDAAKAFYWNEKVAEQGIPDAQRKVGAAYAIGHGVPRDDMKAYVWLTVANEGPNVGLRDKDSEDLILSAVAARLTPAQMSDAMKQAVALKAKIDAGGFGVAAESGVSKPSP